MGVENGSMHHTDGKWQKCISLLYVSNLFILRNFSLTTMSNGPLYLKKQIKESATKQRCIIAPLTHILYNRTICAECVVFCIWTCIINSQTCLRFCMNHACSYTIRLYLVKIKTILRTYTGACVNLCNRINYIQVHIFIGQSI